jgi:hypothetical protein
MSVLEFKLKTQNTPEALTQKSDALNTIFASLIDGADLTNLSQEIHQNALRNTDLCERVLTVGDCTVHETGPQQMMPSGLRLSSEFQETARLPREIRLGDLEIAEITSLKLAFSHWADELNMAPIEAPEWIDLLSQAEWRDIKVQNYSIKKKPDNLHFINEGAEAMYGGSFVENYINFQLGVSIFGQYFPLNIRVERGQIHVEGLFIMASALTKAINKTRSSIYLLPSKPIDPDQYKLKDFPSTEKSHNFLLAILHLLRDKLQAPTQTNS